MYPVWHIDQTRILTRRELATVLADTVSAPTGRAWTWSRSTPREPRPCSGKGCRRTLRRFPHALIVMELHLQRDPPQAVSLFHQIERAGYALRTINYEGEMVPAEGAAILAQPGGALDAVAERLKSLDGAKVQWCNHSPSFFFR
jgi:hypothetical protein